MSLCVPQSYFPSINLVVRNLPGVEFRGQFSRIQLDVVPSGGGCCYGRLVVGGHERTYGGPALGGAATLDVVGE